VTSPAARLPLTLADAALGVRHAVQSLACPASAPHWAQWLEEIGFLPGERVVLMARAQPGGDPLVVRVGSSTFALRRAEAACVRLAGAAGAP
jgi:ferrous iron transport protein A